MLRKYKKGQAQKISLVLNIKKELGFAKFKTFVCLNLRSIIYIYKYLPSPNQFTVLLVLGTRFHKE